MAKNESGGVLLLVASLAPAMAFAQDADTVLLRETAADDGYVSKPGVRFDETAFEAVTSVMYELDPLVVRTNGDRVSTVVPHRATLTAALFAVPIESLGLWASTAYHWSLVADGVSVSGGGLGRTELGAAWHLFTLWGVRAAPEVALVLPGSSGGLVSDVGLGFLPGLTLELDRGRWAAMTNVAIAVRPRSLVGPGLETSPALNALAAGRYDFGAVVAIAELDARQPLAAPDGARPIELRAAAQGVLGDAWRVRGGVGFGLSQGYGAPVLRAFLGLLFDIDLALEGEPPEVIVTREDTSIDREVMELPRWYAPTSTVPATSRELCPRIGGVVHFEQNQAEISGDGLVALARVAEQIRKDDSIYHVVVEGHASAEGDRAYNWTLSMRRADAVHRFLVDAGVEPHRLSIRGLGEVAPELERGEKIVPRDRRVLLCITRRLDVLDRDPDWAAYHIGAPWEDEP